MTQLVLNIPDNKLNFFLEVLKNFRFVKVKEKNEMSLDAQQKEFVDDIKQSLHEVELHQQGKIKLQSARDFLNEL